MEPTETVNDFRDLVLRQEMPAFEAVRSLLASGYTLDESGEGADAQTLYLRAADLAEQFYSCTSVEFSPYHFGLLTMSHGNNLLSWDKPAAAFRSYRRAIELFEECRAYGTTVDCMEHLAYCNIQAAQALRELHDLSRAISFCDRGCSLWKSLSKLLGGTSGAYATEMFSRAMLVRASL